MAEGDRRTGEDTHSGGLSSRRSPVHEYLAAIAGMTSPPNPSFSMPSSSTSSSSSVNEPTREGFDLDMFIKCDEKYHCPICMMVMRDPVQTPCGHRFCDLCMRHWIRGKRHPHCPVCQNTVTKMDIFPDNYAKREVMSLSVWCKHHKEGCKQLMELRHQDDHEKECLYALVDCPNGCSDKIPRSQLDEHTEHTCLLRYEFCPHCDNRFRIVDFQRHNEQCEEKKMDCKYCHKTYRKKEMERHVHLECPRATVECLFQRFGCQQKFERSEEDEHMRREVVKHLSLLCYHFPVTNPLGPVKYYDISQSAPVISTLASITAPPTLGLSTDPGFCSDYSGTSTVYSTAPNRYPIAHSMEVQSSDAPLLPHTKPPTASCFPINIPHNSYEHQCRPNTFPLEPEPWRSEETTRELVTRLKLTVEDQKNQLKQQGMKLQQQERTIRQLDVQLKEVEGRFCNGIYIWRIREYSQKRKDAIERKATVHHSPGFYTSPHGYKMCIRANLNGVESGTGTHLSLFVHVMQGEYDEILPWPFLGHVVLSILDQTGEKHDISETLLAKPGLAAFHKPATKRNNKGFGYIEFAPLSGFYDDRYIRNDTMMIKAVVKSDELVTSAPTT